MPDDFQTPNLPKFGLEKRHLATLAPVGVGLGQRTLLTSGSPSRLVNRSNPTEQQQKPKGKKAQTDRSPSASRAIALLIFNINFTYN
jgi:hypothetical protein